MGQKMTEALSLSFKITLYNLYAGMYNLLFARWRHVGDGHYHFFKEKEYK